ncbi:MAG TPA: Gfo/Idh/MocA family oxidoreductase [Verrucomicrobiae bacterium]|nr:Gfo/Idh/MocA family oxidoreductase [Verrucomicrobiae bacterium]
MRTVLAESRPPGCPNSQTFCRPKLGFLGADGTGKTRLEAIARSGVADITAIADPVPELAAKAARTFPEAAVLTSLDDLVEVGVDGIVIATPSALRAEQATAALERGMAIFCARSPGRTATEVRRVVDAARAADRLMGIDLPYRSRFRKIHDLCQHGELGEIFAVDLVFHSAPELAATWFCDSTSGGGCVMDLGFHLLDLALWNLNFPRIANATSHLFARGNTFQSHRDAAEDDALAQLDLENGTTIKLACSWKLPTGCGAIISASFYGTKGGAALQNVNGSLDEFSAARFHGSRRETIACTSQTWSGLAAIDWAERLANGERFSNDIEHLTHTMTAMDAIYAGAARVPDVFPADSNQSFSLSQSIEAT